MRRPRTTGVSIGRRADGSLITAGDLPGPEILRWTARIKANVVDAIDAGIVTVAEACDAYDLSPEELASWRGTRARSTAQAKESQEGGAARRTRREGSGRALRSSCNPATPGADPAARTLRPARPPKE